MEEKLNQYYQNLIRQGLDATPISPDLLLSVLKEMKEIGIAQEVAYKILNGIYNTQQIEENSKDSETLLALMDVVTRYCRPEKYIW